MYRCIYIYTFIRIYIYTHSYIYIYIVVFPKQTIQIREGTNKIYVVDTYVRIDTKNQVWDHLQ